MMHPWLQFWLQNSQVFCQPLRLQRSCPCAPVWIFVSFQRKTRTCPTCPKFFAERSFEWSRVPKTSQNLGGSATTKSGSNPLWNIWLSLLFPFPLKKSPNIPQPCFPCLTVIFVSFVPSHIILKKRTRLCHPCPSWYPECMKQSLNPAHVAIWSGRKSKCWGLKPTKIPMLSHVHMVT